MSRGSIILLLLLIVIVAGAIWLGKKDISIAPTRVEKVVSADAKAQ
jgi:hypothetical protein